jgi:ribonuclease BN (tRNA processing enzyme)
VNEILVKTRCVFITHIHGDHQLGILKIICERDKLIAQMAAEGKDISDNKLYIVTPTPMIDYMDEFRRNGLKLPDSVVLVPSSDLNPERVKYYGRDSSYAEYRKQQKNAAAFKEELKELAPVCTPLSYEEMIQRVE